MSFILSDLLNDHFVTKDGHAVEYYEDEETTDAEGNYTAIWLQWTNSNGDETTVRALDVVPKVDAGGFFEVEYTIGKRTSSLTLRAWHSVNLVAYMAAGT